MRANHIIAVAIADVAHNIVMRVQAATRILTAIMVGAPLASAIPAGRLLFVFAAFGTYVIANKAAQLRPIAAVRCLGLRLARSLLVSHVSALRSGRQWSG